MSKEEIIKEYDEILIRTKAVHLKFSPKEQVDKEVNAYSMLSGGLKELQEDIKSVLNSSKIEDAYSVLEKINKDLKDFKVIADYIELKVL